MELKKPYHHGDLREALQMAAESALADLPLAEVSLREIARRPEFPTPRQRHHFASLGHCWAKWRLVVSTVSWRNWTRC